jgi:hypothetical protein
MNMSSHLTHSVKEFYKYFSFPATPHMTRMGKTKNAHKVLVKNIQRKRQLGKLDFDVRNIKMGL